MVMPPLWVHFYGVGVSALAASVLALLLMTVGARRGDARTVLVGGGFTVMAVLLAVHGLVTPGVLVGNNGVIALTGGATLPVGAAVLALSGVPRLNARRSIPFLLGLVAASVAVIVAVSLVGVLVPSLVPERAGCALARCLGALGGWARALGRVGNPCRAHLPAHTASRRPCCRRWAAASRECALGSADAHLHAISAGGSVMSSNSSGSRSSVPRLPTTCIAPANRVRSPVI